MCQLLNRSRNNSMHDITFFILILKIKFYINIIWSSPTPTKADGLTFSTFDVSEDIGKLRSTVSITIVEAYEYSFTL